MHYTIHDAEKALQHGHPGEDTLKRYSVDILQELCARRGLKIVQKGSRRLKRPYIDALLEKKTRLTITLPHFLPKREMQNKKRTAEVVEDTENRGRKRQCRSEESITIHSPQPTTVEQSPSTMSIIHESMPSVDIRMDNATLASGQHSMRIPDVNVNHTLDPASQSSKIAIPSKRRNPFGGEPRKKNKTARYVDVRIYAQRRDLGHTHEIRCALTPDGGLDLGSLSQRLNLKGCQASYCNTQRTLDY